MMDITALFKISYGLYIIGAKDGAKNAGCVVNTVAQSTANPVTLTVCINKDNHTNAVIKATKSFSVSILSEHVNAEIIRLFGFTSSKDTDKFAQAPYSLTPSGLPYINNGVTGYLQCKVIDFIDNYTHTIFIAEVEEAENLTKEPPMTYAYYHSVVKGKTAKNAPTYVADEVASANADEAEPSPGAKVYKCAICGFEYSGGDVGFEQLPDDYLCPICRAAKEKFTKA